MTQSQLPQDGADWMLLAESVRSWLRSSPEARVSALRLAGWLINTINEAQLSPSATAAAEAPAAESVMPYPTKEPLVSQQEVLPFVAVAETQETAAAAGALHSGPVEAVETLGIHQAAAQILQGRLEAARLTAPRVASAAQARQPVDLELVSNRLRLKGAASRWHADRLHAGPPTGAMTPEQGKAKDALIAAA